MDLPFSVVEVALAGRSYRIEIGPGLLQALGSRLKERLPVGRAFVVTDSTVGPLHAEAVRQSLTSAGIRTIVETIPAGDASKSLDQAARLYDCLAAAGHRRDEPVIALGGGMVGDLAGFVAATWMRGVPLVQCPTTLEAAIDAAVGGKTALNHACGKNLIGAIHQPVLVQVDINCLSTLSDRDYSAGLAESVKHAVVGDATFLKWQAQNAGGILRRDPGEVTTLIQRNCAIKAAEVVADEREEAIETVGRAMLNFGHTVGHAIEAEFEYKLRHGEAVALGMSAELDLSVSGCGFPDRRRAEIEALMEAFGLPRKAPGPIDAEGILQRMQLDKKSRGGDVRFVLLRDVERPIWAAPTEAELLQALKRLA